MQRVKPGQILIPHRSFSDKRLTGNGFRQRENSAEKCNFRETGMRKQLIPTILFSRKNRNRNGSNRCNSNPPGSFQIKDKTENGFGNEITERKAWLSRNWNAKATTSNLSFSQKNGNATGSTEAIPFPHRIFQIKINRKWFQQRDNSAEARTSRNRNAKATNFPTFLTTVHTQNQIIFSLSNQR